MQVGEVLVLVEVGALERDRHAELARRRRARDTELRQVHGQRPAVRERGVQPTRLDKPLVAGDWLRLTLTRGRKEIHLKAEHWTGARLIRTDEYATPVSKVRDDVGGLLARIVPGAVRTSCR